MKGIKIIQHKASEWFALFMKDIAKGFRIGIGFLLAITTAGIFAVSVTGTFNTFSSGALLKSSDINTNFATLKTAIESIPSQPSMRLVHEKDFTTAAQTYTVTGLDGNTDVQYQIYTRIRNQSGSSTDLYLRPNGDTGSNYGFQLIAGNNTTPAASRSTSFTGMLLANSILAGQIGQTTNTCYMKTGFERSCISTGVGGISGTTMFQTDVDASVWNNTSSNVTSLDFYSSQTNGIGVGSHIEVWARR
jgi:hypothetical protein